MPLFQFKTMLMMTMVLLIALAMYVVYSISALYRADAKAESERLVMYGARVLTRYQANPQDFLQARLPSGIPLGGQRYHVVFGYEDLLDIFNNPPQKNIMKTNQITAFGFDFTSILRLPNYTLILPIYLEDKKTIYVYKNIYRNDGAMPINVRVVEVIQPALAIALICISSLVLVGMYHISRVHSGVVLFEQWAKKIRAGEKESPPIFPSSKLNYIAFAINNSLINVSESLENEHNFASFTSHELKSSVAILSANLEMLEYIKKDLSPQEKLLIKNMDSAISDMKHYMEAFLWLGSERTSRNLVCFDAKVVVEKSIDENVSLFKTDKVQVFVELESCDVFSEEPLFYVLVNNVLRNAFQHTASGAIHVFLRGRQLEICNIPEVNGSAIVSAGFGIGTKIIERLTDRLGVVYKIDSLAGGRRVLLFLP